MKNVVTLAIVFLVTASCSKKPIKLQTIDNPTPGKAKSSAATPIIVASSLIDTFVGGYVLLPDGNDHNTDVTEKINLPVMFYISKIDRDLIHVTSNTTINANLTGFPLIVDFSLPTADIDWYDIGSSGQILEFRNDTLFFRWKYKELMKNPTGYEYKYSIGYLWGKNAKR